MHLLSAQILLLIAGLTLSVNADTLDDSISRFNKLKEKDYDAIYKQWNENDEDDDDSDGDDESPDARHQPAIDLEELKKTKDPEQMLRLSKKGQSLMMFVSVVDPSADNGKPEKAFTERLSIRWQSMFNNNHIDVQAYVVQDDRILFMFKDGSRAWEARDELIKHVECNDVTLEGKVTPGAGSSSNGKKRTEL